MPSLSRRLQQRLELNAVPIYSHCQLRSQERALNLLPFRVSSTASGPLTGCIDTPVRLRYHPTRIAAYAHAIMNQA